jgi:hypothetical protein
MTIAQLIILKDARVTGVKNRIDKERELWAALINESCKLYEVKEIDINLDLHPTYLNDNFDGTGLGINAMVGFAICNGLNATRNRTGRAAIGYGTGYTVIGEPIGTPDSVVVAHTHAIKGSTNTSGGTGAYGNNNVTNNGANYSTESTGVSGIGKNIPPSIITLMIQRIV